MLLQVEVEWCELRAVCRSKNIAYFNQRWNRRGDRCCNRCNICSCSSVRLL